MNMTPGTGDAHTKSDASDFVAELVRAVKTGALYDKGHPKRSELTNGAWSALTSLIFGRELLRFEVSYEGLTVNDGLVDTEDGNEVVRRFNEGGLVSLTLKQNIKRDELDGIVELLAVDFTKLRLEDDLATMLWERDWPNVTWEAADAPLAPMGDESSTYNSSPHDDRLPEPLHPTVVAPHLFVLSDAERAEVQSEADDAHRGMTPTQMGVLLCKLVALESRTLELGITLQHFRSVVDYAISEGRFHEARATAALLADLLSQSTSLTEEKRSAIAACWSGFSHPGTIEEIVNALEAGRWDDPGEVVAFIRERAATITGPLLDAFLKMENVEGREIVRLSLVELLRKDLAPLEPRLAKFQGERVLFLVRLLRDVGGKGVVTILKGILEEGSADVRREVLSALARVGGAHSRTIIIRALSDPALPVRCRAAMMLPEVGAKEALDPLLKEMLHPDFRNRELDERLHFFRALGETNVTKVLPLIRKLIYQRGWWKRSRVEDDRLCAVTALIAMTHPEAVALRRELAENGPRSVRAHLSALNENREAA